LSFICVSVCVSGAFHPRYHFVARKPTAQASLCGVRDCLNRGLA
jgi:hypothetical protein